MAESSVQERYAPQNACFGCGPANERGLRIRSFEQGDLLVCEWEPSSHHEAFEGVLNGGIVGTLLDCHCNWAAAMFLLHRDDRDDLPCTVTADYHIRLRRPTPSDRPVRLEAEAVEDDGPKVIVEGRLLSGGEVCATCRGTFVAVKPGHPAYHRW